MERLTTVEQGCCIACFECKDEDTDCGCLEIDKCLHRLRDYESTGLTPEEIMDGKILTRWIPVDELLPKDGEHVLVWYEYFRYGDYNEMFQTYGIGYQYDGNWGGDAYGTKARCIAWMPLPEPFNPQK